MEVLGSLPRDTLTMACRRFRQRIEATVEAVTIFLNSAMQDINLENMNDFEVNPLKTNIYVTFSIFESKVMDLLATPRICSKFLFFYIHQLYFNIKKI